MKIFNKKETEKLIPDITLDDSEKKAKTNNKKVLFWLLLVAVICAVIIAICYVIKCREKAQENTAQSVEFRDFEKPTQEQIDNGKLNIYMITKSYGSGYWETLIQGAIDAAAETDVNLFIAGTEKETSTDKLAELLEEALEMNPDAIIVSPADTSEINRVVNKINEQDIPLIFIDTMLNGQNFDVCYMTDNMQAGRMAAASMISKLKEAGYTKEDEISVGIEIGSKQSQTIIERLAGVNEYWSNFAPDNWKIIDTIKCNDGSADVAYKQCLEFFDENKNLAGLIGLNNGSTVGLCRGLLEKERTDVALAGFDYSDDIANLIAGGEYHVSTMVQRQYNMGSGSIESAVSICRGTESKFKYYNTGVSKVDHSNYLRPYIIQNVLR